MTTTSRTRCTALDVPLGVGQQALRVSLSSRDDGTLETLTLATGWIGDGLWCEVPGSRLALPARILSEFAAALRQLEQET